MQYLCDTTPGLKLTTFDIIAPTTHAKIVENFRAHVASIKSSAEYSKSSTKIVLVIDALASKPGLLLPWEKIVQLSHKEDILTIVDAAHAIGQQVNINLRTFATCATLICLFCLSLTFPTVIRP